MGFCLAVYEGMGTNSDGSVLCDKLRTWDSTAEYTTLDWEVLFCDVGGQHGIGSVVSGHADVDGGFFDGCIGSGIDEDVSAKRI